MCGQRCYELLQRLLESGVNQQEIKFITPDFNLISDFSVQIKDTYNQLLDLISNNPLEDLAISYNGGKDCLVLLIIYMAAIYSYYGDNHPPVKAVYIHSEPGFSQQMKFLFESVKFFKLKFTVVNTYSASPNIGYQNIENLQAERPTLAAGFETYLKYHPVKMIIAGIRRSDPHGAKLKTRELTGGNWPKFVRINPILEWNTAKIWGFIRWFSLHGFKYCSLYDEGYTSLGGRENTIKNPLLKRGDSYLSAWQIVDDDVERLGRVQKL
ncbi:FMN adenylyltransferase [Martiniozyma asiatica (nom. inval.)]|nr:FMN adenylyltransferase [Martiniozyma asiatica]